jgi:hypothetical protein
MVLVTPVATNDHGFANVGTRSRLTKTLTVVHPALRQLPLVIEQSILVLKPATSYFLERFFLFFLLSNGVEICWCHIRARRHPAIADTAVLIKNGACLMPTTSGREPHAKTPVTTRLL